jgi:hypothetical protein
LAGVKGGGHAGPFPLLRGLQHAADHLPGEGDEERWALKPCTYQTPADRLNPDFKKGDLMVIEDHINLQPA